MNKRYLVLPACFSIFLNVAVLGIVAVNLCDYGSVWSIVGCWALVIVLACLFRMYVFIPYAILWWGALYCRTDGYSIGAVLVLTGMVVAATLIASVVHAINNHSGKPDRKSQGLPLGANKKELDFPFIVKCTVYSAVCPPAAAALGILTMLGTARELTSKK